MTDGPDLTDRATFTHWYQEKLRFSDTDMVGHINNVAFLALIEGGRVNFTRSGVIAGLPDDKQFVMRRIELDYRAELHWPAEIDIGSCLLRVGRSSCTIGNVIFDGDRCAATSVTILVLIDRETRRASPMTQEMRAGMERHLTGSGSC